MAITVVAEDFRGPEAQRQRRCARGDIDSHARKINPGDIQTIWCESVVDKVAIEIGLRTAFEVIFVFVVVFRSEAAAAAVRHFFDLPQVGLIAQVDHA